MSQTKFNSMLTIVPQDKTFVPAAELCQGALKLFQQLIPYAEEYRAETFDQIHFISPEMFANSVNCPVCDSLTERYGTRGSSGRKWFADMDEMWAFQPVENLNTVLPTCGHAVSFTDLKFDWPAGFAKFALSARLNYWNEEMMSDNLFQSEEINTLEKFMGIKLIAVRTYFALHETDRKIIADLMSANDDVRLEAAQALEALETGHFENYMIYSGYIEDIAERLLTAYRETAHYAVKSWILYLLGDAAFVNDEVIEIVSSELVLEGQFLQQVLYIIFKSPAHFNQLIHKVKQLHAHPDRRVRWRCAMGLRYLAIDYERDAEVIKILLLDIDHSTRLQAFFALKELLQHRSLNASDRAVLEQLIEMDSTGAAAHYAKELLRQNLGGSSNIPTF